MNIHIGNLVKKVADDKRVKPGQLAKRLAMHSASFSRIVKYKEINTKLLKKLCAALEYDFFKEYSDELKLPRAEKEKTWSEKQLEELSKENERLKQELVYLKTINEMVMAKK